MIRRLFFALIDFLETADAMDARLGVTLMDERGVE